MQRLLTSLAVLMICASPVWAQSERRVRLDREGDFHVRSQFTVGEKTLNRGMYRASRIAANGTNYVVFRKVTMGSPWRSMGPAWVSTEVARIKCVDQGRGVVNQRSEIMLKRSEGNRWGIVEVRFKGERYACEPEYQR